MKGGLSLTVLANKNAFQWDAYRPLVGCIPACTAQGVCVYPSMHWARESVSQNALGRECLARGCLPRGWGCVYPGGCVCPGGVFPGEYGRHPPDQRQTPPPPWTEWLTDRCKNITLPQLRCGRWIWSPSCPWEAFIFGRKGMWGMWGGGRSKPSYQQRKKV